MDIRQITKDINNAIECCEKNNKDEYTKDNVWFGGVKKLMSLASSPMIPAYLRSRALFSLYDIDPEFAHENLIKIQDSLDFSEGDILNNSIELLRKVVFSSVFNSEQRYLCALNCFNSDLVECFDFFSILIEDVTVMLIHRVECAKFLFYSQQDQYIEKALTYLKEVIENKTLECSYRYETIACFISETGIAAKYNTNRLPARYDEEFVFPLQYDFFFDQGNGIRERLLSGQYLLQMEEHEDIKPSVEENMIEIARDDTLEHTVRADAADILLRVAITPTIKREAANIIKDLGNEDVYNELNKNIYSNKENVHNSKFQESVDKYIEQIVIHETTKGVQTFEETHRTVITLIDSMDLIPAKRVNAYKSLNRISVDSAKFTSFSLTSARIFCNIWARILAHPQVDELKTRLVEELIDMADTCSTGHANRLVNVFSAYDENAMTMDITDQLCANIRARINTLIKNIENEDEREQIICGMAASKDDEDYMAYISFLKSNQEILKGELYLEFVNDGYISKSLFNTTFDEEMEKIIKSN